MSRCRVIPCLLIRDGKLVKTVRFAEPRYIGDPVNAVRIFNRKEVDELIFLDITASKDGRKPFFDFVKDIATECFMPFCYGGGIKTIEDIRNIFFLGAEKVSINSRAIENPYFIKAAAEIFGSQSIVVSIDYRKDQAGSYGVYDSSRNKLTAIKPVDFAVQMSSMGAGEILLNSVDRDGTFEGYDIDVIKEICSAVNVPVIACGGAGTVEDFNRAVKTGGASAVAAGSLFVFHGKHKAVLINYPSSDELEGVLA